VCLAIPGKVLSVEGEGYARFGQVDFAGVRKRVSLSCLPKATVGQYVMVHAGMAITVVDEAEALSVFEYLREAEAEGESPA